MPLRFRQRAQAQALASAKVSRGRPGAGATMPEAASFSLNADMSGPASASSCEISRSVPAVLEDLLFDRGMAGAGERPEPSVADAGQACAPGRRDSTVEVHACGTRRGGGHDSCSQCK